MTTYKLITAMPSTMRCMSPAAVACAWAAGGSAIAAVGPILGYTVLHGLAFIAFGVVAATMMAMSEREPALFVAFVILFAAFEVFFFGVLGALGQ